MKHYSIADNKGEIIVTTYGEKPLLSIYPEGADIIDGELSTKTEYIADGEIVARPEFQIIVSALRIINTDISFSHIPEGCKITHPSGESTMDAGGVLEWQTPEPGQYRFRFELFPYIPKDIVIEISA